MKSLSRSTRDRTRPLTAWAALVHALVLLAAAAPAHGAPAREFSLGAHGTLALEVPDGWTAAFSAAGDAPPTLALSASGGEPFEIRVTVLWPPGGEPLPEEAALRAEVDSAATSAAAQSVERTLALEPLTGVAVHGFYFRATDRAPKPGEYKYLTQGMARAGGVLLAFTVLSNDGHPEVPEAALAMLRSAVHRPRGGSGGNGGRPATGAP